MESAVSICYETLERQLGRHIPDLQVFQGCQNSLLYDQRHRIAEFNAAAAEPTEERIPRISGITEVAVSRNIRSHTQVDDADSQLGKSARRIVDHVPGALA